MDINNLLFLEVVKGENKFTFSFGAGVPLGELYDAAFQILSKVDELCKEAVERAQKEMEAKLGTPEVVIPEVVAPEVQ
jgi:hypothetical protein